MLHSAFATLFNGTSIPYQISVVQLQEGNRSREGKHTAMCAVDDVCLPACQCLCKYLDSALRVFSEGGGDWGGPPVGENLVDPPIRNSSPYSNQSLPPYPTFVPENFQNLSTFLYKF